MRRESSSTLVGWLCTAWHRTAPRGALAPTAEPRGAKPQGKPPGRWLGGFLKSGTGQPKDQTMRGIVKKLSPNGFLFPRGRGAVRPPHFSALYASQKSQPGTDSRRRHYRVRVGC